MNLPVEPCYQCDNEHDTVCDECSRPLCICCINDVDGACMCAECA